MLITNDRLANARCMHYDSTEDKAGFIEHVLFASHQEALEIL